MYVLKDFMDRNASNANSPSPHTIQSGITRVISPASTAYPITKATDKHGVY